MNILLLSMPDSSESCATMLRMMAHTFRSSTLKSLVRFKNPHKTFVRYRAFHRTKREYL